MYSYQINYYYYDKTQAEGIPSTDEGESHVIIKNKKTVYHTYVYLCSVVLV